MNNLDKKIRLSSKVQQDLIARSKQGIWAHPLCMILVLMTTGLTHRTPALSLFFAAGAVTLTLLRIATMYTSFPGQRCSERLHHRMHLGLLLSCSALWGIVPGFALWKLGYQDKDLLILLLYHAAIIFGTVNLLLHDRKLIALSLALLFVPTIVGSLLHGGPGPFNYVAAAAAYLLYCLAQGKKLHESYQSQISDNYDLSVAAYRDCLTGLPNRLYMNQALETCFEKATTSTLQIALLYIDLDGFKQINDRHSHRVGDLFLCEAASRIRGSLRKSDIAARIGGDEFTILLSNCLSEQDALATAARVLTDARLPVIVNGHELSYSASIGVSLFPHTADDLDTLVRSADEAMYVAKASGKDRICLQMRDGQKQIVNLDLLNHSLLVPAN